MNSLSFDWNSSFSPCGVNPVMLSGKWEWLEFEWLERAGSPNDPPQKNIYRPIIDSRTGDLYAGDSVRRIALKSLGLSVGYLLGGALKTVYHLCLPVSLVVEGKRGGLKAIGKNIADIVRTPIYAVALAILSLANAILGLSGSAYVYELRSLIGRMEYSLNWEELRTKWTLAICFQPLNTLRDNPNDSGFAENLTATYAKRNHADTQYIFTSPEQKAAANFARAQVQFYRTHRNYCNDCQVVPARVPFDSSIHT